MLIRQSNVVFVNVGSAPSMADTARNRLCMELGLGYVEPRARCVTAAKEQGSC